MATQRIFRLAIVAWWASVVSAVVASFALEPMLPELLLVWLIEEAEAPLSGVELGLLTVGAILIVALLVTSVGLFRLRRGALVPFLCVNVAGLLLAALLGPVVLDPVSGALDDLSDLLAGVILAMGFFSDVFSDVGAGEAVAQV